MISASSTKFLDILENTKNKKTNRENSRVTAVLPCNSVMLQAPAGSGKTELIVRRYIRILSQSNTHPREILVLTFTRKTAREIKKRILKKINENKYRGGSKFLAHAFSKKLMEKRKKHKWDLFYEAKDILVSTVDSFCLYIINKHLSNQSGESFLISNNPELVYKHSIKNLFLGMFRNPPWRPDFRRILSCVANKLGSLETLFIEMLSCRDQWFSIITCRRKNPLKLMKGMSAAIEKVVAESFSLSKIYQKKYFIKEIIPISDFFACSSLSAKDKHDVGILKGSHSISIINNIVLWNNLLHCLDFILKPNQKTASLADNKLESIILEKINKKAYNIRRVFKKKFRLFREIADLSLCTSMFYDKGRQLFISSIIKILPILITYLEMTFRSVKTLDFTSLNILALRLLNNSLSQRKTLLEIKHILIDEFQDISPSQFSLIKKISLNWGKSAHSSFFAAGDPSQSIYRFRNADVSLFLAFSKKDFINKNLKIIKLRKNFRSCRSLTYWVNTLFKNIFSCKFNICTGSTTHNTSKSMGKDFGDVRWYIKNNDKYNIEESKNVSFIVRSIKKKFPNDTIAILFRSRRHIEKIKKQLRKDFVSFEFIDHEYFSKNLEVKDIFIMFCAVLLGADKNSWVSFLNSPLFGLSFRDINIISHFENNAGIYRLLKSGALPRKLSGDALSRIKIYLPIFYKMTLYNKILSITTVINLALKELSLKKIISSGYQNISVVNFLKEARGVEKEKLLSVHNLSHLMEGLGAEHENKVQSGIRVMTIHQSKGLEFDHVIIPGLHRRVSSASNKIINWETKMGSFGSQEMLLSTFKKEDCIGRYIDLIERERSRNETARLLYVAVTRSKKSINLLASLETNNQGNIRTPIRDTFLEIFWNQSISTIQKSFKKLNFNSIICSNNQEISRNRCKRSFIDSKNTFLPLEGIRFAKNNNKPREIYTNVLDGLLYQTIVMASTGRNLISKKYIKKRFTKGIFNKKNFIQYLISVLKKSLKRLFLDPRSQWMIFGCFSCHYKTECQIKDDDLFWSIKKVKFADIANIRLFSNMKNKDSSISLNTGIYSTFSSHWVESGF